MKSIIDFFAPPLVRFVAVLAALGSLYAGVRYWGYSQYQNGVATERAAWEAAAHAERERQASVKQATEALGVQIVAQLGARMEGLERELKDLSDVAAAEDAKPVPDACRDVYRGLSPDVLRRLEGIR